MTTQVRRKTIGTPHLLIFTLDGQRYGLHLDRVRHVIAAAAVTPLPHAPDVVAGVLDLHGEVIPVINLRKRFRLPEREICCDDHFVVARSETRPLALVVDSAEGVVDDAEQVVVPPEEIVEGIEFLQGVTRTEQGLVLIHDLDTLLFPREERLLSVALEQSP